MYNLIISTQHVQLSDALESKIKSDFSKQSEKIEEFIHGNVNITLKVENNNHTAECSFHSKKHQFFASESTSDMYLSIDKVFTDVFNQAKKQKNKNNNHQNTNKRNAINDL
jgi:putative sigma-54 modulation protein